MGRSDAVRSSFAFAPGHLTGFFSPRTSARDPRGRGSVGAGLVLDRGVTAAATWEPEAPTGTVLRSTPVAALPVSRTVAARLRAGRPGRLNVRLVHELPIGQGLGMSAAGAVATALAVGRLFDVPPGRAWEVAHLAELFGRGGLGGVAAIQGGGLEIRERPGLPPRGRVRRIGVRAPVLLLRCGRRLPSPEALSDRRALARIQRAGDRAVRAFRTHPGLRSFLSSAERFTDEARLADPAMRGEIARLRARGLFAAQAMFGRLIYVIPRVPSELPEFRSYVRSVAESGRARLVSVGRSGAHPTAAPDS